MANEVAEGIYAHAHAKLAAGDTSGAIRSLTRAVAGNPDEGQLWSLLGIAQWSVGAVSDSVESLETALTLVPLGADSRLALALGYEVLQKQSLAKDLFVGIAEEEHLPYAVFEPLARALARNEKPSLALDICKRAAAYRPDAPGPLRGVAFYMGRLDREPEEILPVLFRAFHLDPEDFDTRLLLARRLHQCDRSIEAAYLLSAVQISSSRCPSCLNAMREIFVEAGDIENTALCTETLVALAQDSDPSPGCQVD